MIKDFTFTNETPSFKIEEGIKLQSISFEEGSIVRTRVMNDDSVHDKVNLLGQLKYAVPNGYNTFFEFKDIPLLPNSEIKIHSDEKFKLVLLYK